MWTGWLLVLVGLGLQFWVRGRMFKRRNAAGLEMFKSYGRAVGTESAERLVYIVARLLVVPGAAWLISAWQVGRMWGQAQVDSARRIKAMPAAPGTGRWPTGGWPPTGPVDAPFLPPICGCRTPCRPHATGHRGCAAAAPEQASAAPAPPLPGQCWRPCADCPQQTPNGLGRWGSTARRDAAPCAQVVETA